LKVSRCSVQNRIKQQRRSSKFCNFQTVKWTEPYEWRIES
jgi:hypothetical protein